MTNPLGVIRRKFFSPKPRPIWLNQRDELKQYEIGDWTYGEPDIRDWGQASTLRIGKFCSIARGVVILLGGEHRTDWVTTFPFAELLPPAKHQKKIGFSKGGVTIGHDVWIGTEAFIRSGITIGDGAVVAARAVVTKSVRPYSIVAGNPAKHLRYRVPEELIPQMLRIAWWDWSLDRIVEAFPLLMSEKIQGFVTKYGSGNNCQTQTEEARL